MCRRISLRSYLSLDCFVGNRCSWKRRSESGRGPLSQCKTNKTGRNLCFDHRLSHYHSSLFRRDTAKLTHEEAELGSDNAKFVELLPEGRCEVRNDNSQGRRCFQNESSRRLHGPARTLPIWWATHQVPTRCAVPTTVPSTLSSTAPTQVSLHQKLAHDRIAAAKIRMAGFTGFLFGTISQVRSQPI